MDNIQKTLKNIERYKKEFDLAAKIIKWLDSMDAPGTVSVSASHNVWIDIPDKAAFAELRRKLGRHAAPTALFIYNKTNLRYRNKITGAMQFSYFVSPTPFNEEVLRRAPNLDTTDTLTTHHTDMIGIIMGEVSAGEECHKVKTGERTVETYEWKCD